MNINKLTKNLFTKKNFLLVVAFILLQILVLIVARPIIIDFYLLSEDHFEPYPEIDTIFAPGFTHENFEKITNGMTTEEVTQLLGEPFRTDPWKILEVENGRASITRNSDTAECWEYSQDGKLGGKPDYSWYSYTVCFEENQVYLKLVQEFFD